MSTTQKLTLPPKAASHARRPIQPKRLTLPPKLTAAQMAAVLGEAGKGSIYDGLLGDPSISDDVRLHLDLLAAAWRRERDFTGKGGFIMFFEAKPLGWSLSPSASDWRPGTIAIPEEPHLAALRAVDGSDAAGALTWVESLPLAPELASAKHRLVIYAETVPLAHGEEACLVILDYLAGKLLRELAVGSYEDPAHPHSYAARLQTLFHAVAQAEEFLRRRFHEGPGEPRRAAAPRSDSDDIRNSRFD